MEASEGGNVQSIVHGQTVIWVLEAAPETDGEVWVTVKVTKALKGQAFANSAMLEVKDQETGQTKKAVTNQVINYVLDDVVKEVLSENGRKNSCTVSPLRIRPRPSAPLPSPTSCRKA